VAFPAMALAPAAALAAGGGGGAVYTPQPKLARIACVRNCAARKRIQGGSGVKITGSNLDAVTKVVFEGGRSKVDDKPVTTRAHSATALQVTVPVGAQSGPVVALASGGVASVPTKPVGILPAPPPEPNVALSPAPGPRDAGAPRLETATSTSRWFLGAQRAVVFSYKLDGSSPSDVSVNLVRESDGAVVQTWTQPGVAPGDVHTVSWNGIVGGQPQPEGRYAFRVVVHSGTASTSNAAADDPNRDAFDLHTHVFPVRGRHDFGGPEARYGAPRAGHTHQGQDVLARCGTREVAAQGGKVIYSGFQSAAGYYLVVHGLDGYDNAYMHLAGRSAFEVGDTIYTGEQIGVVGDTGDATACHLHFEVWTPPGWYNGGHTIDPLPLLQAWDSWS
jgi:murein DD-endopeptidase MepM/ murein hydrolase activator NlpD